MIKITTVYLSGLLKIQFQKILAPAHVRPHTSPSMSLPVELVLAIAREVWRVEDESARARTGVEREFDAGIKPEALEDLATLVEAFIVEATARACALADIEGSRSIEGEHIERVLPQLMLDFAG